LWQRTEYFHGVLEASGQQHDAVGDSYQLAGPYCRGEFVWAQPQLGEQGGVRCGERRCREVGPELPDAIGDRRRKGHLSARVDDAPSPQGKRRR
jgi:hypothetical protein